MPSQCEIVAESASWYASSIITINTTVASDWGYNANHWKMYALDLVFINSSLKSSPAGQNEGYFADDIFKCIFMDEQFCISIRISLKVGPKGHIDNKSALVQIKAWCWIRDKPLPEPMLTQFTDTYKRHQKQNTSSVLYE